MQLPCHDERGYWQALAEVDSFSAVPESALTPIELDALHEAGRFGAWGYSHEEAWA